jgi:outer membrane protein OmpA-like peptidoglycan-associated protein
VTAFSCASLVLTAAWQEERIVLVRTTDAIRLCREDGYEEVPQYRAATWVDRLGGRDVAKVRDFVAQAKLSSFSLTSLDGQGLLALLRARLRSGALAVLREGEGGAGGAGDSQVEQRRLVREIEVKSRHRLSYAGRQYRLVVDASLRRLPDRDSYEVVSHRDAVKVLHALAGQGGPAGGDLAKLLNQAATMLTQDWRPPHNPDGLVLLRRIIVQQAYKPDLGPALTPSQLKQLAKSDWIEIELVDQDGEPFSTHYRLELPDQVVREDRFAEDGFLGVYEIESGDCKLVIGEMKPPAEVSAEAEEEEEVEAVPQEPEQVATEEGEEPEAPIQPEEMFPPSDHEPIAAQELAEEEFSIKIVDEVGSPIAEVPMVFRWDGGEQTVPTGSDGVATCLAPAESASVSFESADALAQVMGSVWAQTNGSTREDWVKPEEGKTIVVAIKCGQVQELFPANGDEIRESDTPAQTDAAAPRLRAWGPLALGVGESLRISVQPLATFVRTVGAYFDLNKCFLLPTAIPTLQKLVDIYKAGGIVQRETGVNRPTGPASAENDVLIVGHTDTSGAPDYNQTLSEERAQSMVDYLRDNVDAWLKWFDSSNTKKKRWGKREEQMMMLSLVPPDEWLDNDVTLAYQKWHNSLDSRSAARPLPHGWEQLEEDGKIGPATRRQLVVDYMNIDGASLDADVQIFSVGCGERYPLKDAEGEIDANPKDGQHEQEDRRVEVFFFPKSRGISPPVDGHKESGQYPTWRQQATLLDEIGGEWQLVVCRLLNEDHDPYVNKLVRVAVSDQPEVRTRTDENGDMVAVVSEGIGYDILVHPRDPRHPAQEYRTFRVLATVGPLDLASSVAGAIHRLRQLNYWRGAIVDDWTQETINALCWFQSDNGLHVTAKLDGATSSLLDQLAFRVDDDD